MGFHEPPSDIEVHIRVLDPGLVAATRWLRTMSNPETTAIACYILLALAYREDMQTLPSTCIDWLHNKTHSRNLRTRRMAERLLREIK